ncbi:EF-hand calcium-binding domain-containing protein 14 [Frankliniella fusca]|uniref:EF-hand calcium-binding domain-containing protein 14 n=1 Tax=Frankliniella fusca TaxID=407009 RepID=A0AAE1H7P2_9NEOP|nr:EF-hand calcium-binding domain-containing protein 14 [Frankliniella fusca]
MECGGVPLRVPLRSGAGAAGAGAGAMSAGSMAAAGTFAASSVGSGSGSGVKKMRKRRELDALAKRCPTTANGGVHKRCSGSGGGLSSHDQLLSESSGDDSACGGAGAPLSLCKPGYSAYSLGGGGGYTPGFAVKRRRPGRGPYPYPHLLRQRPCARVVRACIGLLVLACVIATLTVMWLFIDVREQVFSLRTEIEQVVAGSQAVPDDLQKIHSLSRELQQNQTQLTLRVNTITAQISNLSQQLVVVETGLRVCSEKLQSSSEPSNVKELMTNVALWGSQIKDLDNTVRSLKQQQANLDSMMQTLGKNLTIVEGSVSQLSNASLRPPPIEPNVAHTLENLRQVIAQTSANISEANSTLTKQLQWLQDDQVKDHKAIELLQDLGQNFTARIQTLEGECAKADALNLLNITMLRVKDQVNADSQRLKTVEALVSSLQPAIPETQSNIQVKPSADSGSLMVEEAKQGLPSSMTDSVVSGITTPGG